MTMRELRGITGYASRSKQICFARHLAETRDEFEFTKNGKHTHAARLIYLPNVKRVS